MVGMVSKYPSPMRVWFGPKLVVVISKAEQAAKIMSSSNFNHKDEVYKFIKVFNGEGLISGSGPKWKRDRRLMAPLFAKKNVEEYFSIICHHTSILLEILEKQVGKSFFNVETYLHRCSADFVNESILGIKTEAQNGSFDRFMKAIDKMYDLVHARISKVWLQFEPIYRLTHYYEEQETGKKEVHNFLRKSIRNKEKIRSESKDQDSLLDKIMDIRDEIPDFASEEELIHHMCTLYTASEDTVTTIAAFTLLLLGMYPETQQKIYSEIVNLNTSNLNLEDLSQLNYLDMCLKEVLRLFPIAPFVMRTSAHEFQIEELRIPEGCSVVVAIHNIHRSALYWERPDEFYPEHFLPDSVQKRHSFAYLAFSAGPRGCLGKPFAYMALKITIAMFLMKFSIHAEGKLADIPLKADISVRPKNRQFPIKIQFR